MKKTILLVFLLLLLIVTCTKNPKEAALKKDTPAYELAIQLAQVIPALHPDLNRVMVVTNDFKVTSGEVIRNIYQQQGIQSAQLRELQPAQLKKFILRSARVFAERKMLLTKARQAEIYVADEEVEKQYQELAAKIGDEEKYIQFLAAKGINASYIKERIHKDLAIQQFVQLELGSDFPVVEAEVESVYFEDKTASVRHILLRTEGKSTVEKQALYEQIRRILARAKDGEAFSMLARTYSQDPGSKDRGGLYKDFTRGMMMRSFEYAAFNVSVGEISGIIETPYGYHILKVIERKKETRPLDEVREEIVVQIKRAKQGEAFLSYMARLKEVNQWQIFPL